MYQETVKKKMGKMIDELKVGDKAKFTKKITDREIHLYMGVTGDTNPIYMDRNYAGRTQFEEPIVPGVILMGLIVATISNELPGNGSITVSQSVDFEAPVRWNDMVTTTVEIISIDKKKNRVVLRAICTNQKNETVVKSEVVVMPPIRLKPVMSYAFEDYV